MPEDHAQVLGILGEVEAGLNGYHEPVRHGKTRAMLVAVALRPSELVTTDWLTEALWEGDPPRSALANIRSYACLVRKIPGVAEHLVSRSGGYSFLAGEHDVDYLRFLELVRQARLSAPESTVGLLVEALGMWQIGRASCRERV